MEFPFDAIPIYSQDTVYRLQVRNMKTIIAHPERNRNFVRDINKFMSYVEIGCLVQIDAASIIGVYGREVKEFSKKLIKLNAAHFVASDAHCPKDYSNWYRQAYEKVRKWAGQEYTDELFCSNARSILEGSQEYRSDVEKNKSH
jgi:protein-tyrosine phosphatase